LFAKTFTGSFGHRQRRKFISRETLMESIEASNLFVTKAQEVVDRDGGGALSA
jgi:hypothetical protein